MPLKFAEVLSLSTHPEESAWPPSAPSPYVGYVVELGQPFAMQLGASVGRLPPGGSACPLHWHRHEEEVFVVLSGVLTVRELHPGANAYVEFELHAGDVLVYAADSGIAHQSFNRSAEDVRYLALSSPRHPFERCVYPDSGKTLLRGVGIGLLPGAQPAGVTEVRRLPEPPAWVATVDRVAERPLGTGRGGRSMSRAVGAREVFVNRDRLAAGVVSGPLHRHSANDELVVVVSGELALEEQVDGEPRSTALFPLDVVPLPAASSGLRRLRAVTDAEVLVVGFDRADDVTVFADGTVAVDGERVVFERTPYFP